MSEKKAIMIHELLKSILTLNRQYVYKKMGKVTVYPGQPIIIKTIAENEGISQKDLSDICYKRPATITTMIQKMENQGFIKRVQDEKDKRIIRLYMTEKGRQFHKECRNMSKDIIDRNFKGVTDEELDCIYNALKKIKKNIETEEREELN